MKKIMTLLAVAMIPATLSGCASCPTLCPCCPCNWFNRPACPPPTYCPPPMAAAPCAAPFVAAPACCPPTQMAPQYVIPQAAPMAAASCAPCQASAMQQPMYVQAQPNYYAEPNCGYNVMMEPGCGGPSMVGYAPMESGGCTSGCCDGGMLSAPTPESFDPRPVAE